MSADETADLRRRNRALAQEVERLRAALAADRAGTGVAVEPADETAFGRAFWHVSARIDTVLSEPDPERIDDAEFRRLADHLPILCWLARSDGYLFWYNRRWLDYCGTTQEAMAGWGWRSVHDPAELPRVMEVWAASIATGAPFEMVFPLRGADGVFRPFLTRIVPLRDATGRVVRWFGVNAEIGAQARAEAALRASETRLHRAQEAGGVGIFSVDIASDTVHATPNFFRLYGLREQERLPTDAIIRLVNPEDAGIVSQPADRRAGLVARDVAYRIRRADTGEERWIARRGEFERDGAGRAVRFVGAVRDITDHKLAELRAEANERELRLVADALPVLIAFIDRDFIYRFANAAYQDWFYRPPSEIVGRDVRDLLSPANAEVRRTYMARALAGEAVLFETVWPHADGRHRDAEIRYLPRRDADGAVDGFHVFVQDITDRKRVETALLTEVTQRTRERDRLWETTNDLMGTAGLDGFLKSVNPAWTRMLGWSEPDLLGRPFAALVDPADHAETAAVGGPPRGRRAGDRLRRPRPDAGRRAPGGDVDGGARSRHRPVLHRRARPHRAAPRRGAAAPGAEDGGDRPAHRRHRPRLQQPAHRHRRAPGPDADAHPAGPHRCDLERYARAAVASANRAAALTHRLLAFARRQPLEPQPTAPTRLIAGMEDLLRRTLGERVQLERVTAAAAVADPVRSAPARERAPQPRHQCAGRHAGGRPPRDRDRQHASRPGRRPAARGGGGRGSMSASASAIPAAA